jgi:uncharacterized protein (TIGR03437 family)
VRRVASPADGTLLLAGGGLAAVHGRQLAAREGDATSVRVFVNALPVEVVYAAPDQVNFVLPKGLTGEARLRVETANGTAEQPIQLQESAPAVLMTAHEEGLLPALFHADGERVTLASPGRVGEELTLYLTGTGSLSRVLVKSGAMECAARVEEVTAQPGVDRLFFRVETGAAPAFCIVAGEAASAPVPWWIG